MTVYYDDLIPVGTNYQPAVWGGHTSPAFADDIIFAAPIPSFPVSVFVGFTATGAFSPVIAGVTQISASVAFTASGDFNPALYTVTSISRFATFEATGTFVATNRLSTWIENAPVTTVWIDN